MHPTVNMKLVQLSDMNDSKALGKDVQYRHPPITIS